MPRKKKSEEVENKKDFDINDLESIDGIGPASKESLNENGIETPLDLVTLSDEEIHILTGKDIFDAGRVLTKVERFLEKAGVIPKSSEWNEHEKKKFHISTGSSKLDTMLRGGIESQGVTEIFAENGGGKTQTSLSVVTEALHNNMPVLFIDCEATMEVDRIAEIAESRGYEVNDEFFSNLHREVPLDGLKLERIISKLANRIVNEKIKLVVMDGATGLLRMEYHEGRGDLAPRQNRMKLLHRVKKAAILFNIPVIMTNQVMSNPDQYPGAPKFIPIGGNIVGHTVKYRIFIEKKGPRRRVATFFKSNMDAVSQVEFYLNAAGVSDVETLPKKKNLDASPSGDSEDISSPQEEPRINESKLIDDSLLEA